MSALTHTYENLDESVKAKLQDLSPVLKEVAVDKNKWVYKYRAKGELSPAIFRDFIEHNKALAFGEENRYAYSDDLPVEGILSISQAYQTYATLILDMDLSETALEDIKEYIEKSKKSLENKKKELNDKSEDSDDKEKEEKLAEIARRIADIERKEASFVEREKETVNAISHLDVLFRKMMSKIRGKRFDATPYLDGSKVFDNSHFLDSVTWVGSALLAAIRLHLNGIVTLKDDDYKEVCETLTYILEYIKDSYIGDSDDIDTSIPFKNRETTGFKFGWNFTKGCSEKPSLYFTYTVSEFYLDFYTTFRNAIILADEEYLKKEIKSKFSKEDTVNSKMALVRENLEIEKINRDIALKELETFTKINNGADVYDKNNSVYYAVERCCKRAANRVWDMVRSHQGGLNENFFTADLTATVEERSIEKSISSDAIFNLLFIINIIMDAAIDEDYEDKVSYYTDADVDAASYQQALDNYDELRDALRFAYDNAYLAYTRLVKKHKEYKANEYILGFDEEFNPEFEGAVKELRKARIREFSLMPLLVKAKTTMGEFLIRYPQYDMQIYLESILDHRALDKENEGQYLWLWEKDGYSSSSNFYFISALADFYSYYEEYEAASADDIYEVYKNHLDELRRPDGEIGEKVAEIERLKGEKKSLEEENARTEEIYKLESKAMNDNPLEYGFKMFFRNYMEEYIRTEAVKTLMSKISTEIMDSVRSRIVGESDPNTGNAAYFEGGIHELVKAMLAGAVYAELFEESKNIVGKFDKNVAEGADESIVAYFDKKRNGVMDKVIEDMIKVFREYANPMTKGKNSYYSNFDGGRRIEDSITITEKKSKKDDN